MSRVARVVPAFPCRLLGLRTPPGPPLRPFARSDYERRAQGLRAVSAARSKTRPQHTDYQCERFALFLSPRAASSVRGSQRGSAADEEAAAAVAYLQPRAGYASATSGVPERQTLHAADDPAGALRQDPPLRAPLQPQQALDRKSTRLNS